jgi:hypothetical protein
MADDVETKQRSITNMIADTNVVAAFESTDELAAATARVRESKSTGQKLHLRGRCRKLSRPETLERFCNTAARHGSASVEDVAGADDVPADMYDPADEVAYRIRTDRKARWAPRVGRGEPSRHVAQLPTCYGARVARKAPQPVPSRTAPPGRCPTPTAAGGRGRSNQCDAVRFGAGENGRRHTARQYNDRSIQGSCPWPPGIATKHGRISQTLRPSARP